MCGDLTGSRASSKWVLHNGWVSPGRRSFIKVVSAYQETPDLFYTIYYPDIKSLIYGSIALLLFFMMGIQQIFKR